MVVAFAVASPAAADLWAISTDASFSRVIRFDNDGNELSGGIPTGLAGLLAPSGITIADDGTFYVSSRGDETNSPKILIYTCDDAGNCAPKESPLPEGTPGLFADLGADADPAAPAQLRIGPDGNLYASELFGQKVRVYDPTTGTRLADAATGLPGTGGITFDANDDLLVGTTAVPDPPIPATISRFSAGQQQAPFFVASLGELGFPASLLFLPNGDLLAVDLGLDRLRRFSSDGADLGTFATIPTIIEAKPSFPADVVFDPDGNLIVAVLGPNNPGDPGGNQGQLLRYDLNGDLIETIADELEQVGGLAWTPSTNTLAGDYDGNSMVEPADYAKWAGDFGKWVARGNGADGNNNGTIDAGDYTIWRDGLGDTVGTGAASVAGIAVPEASSLILATLCLLSLAGVRMSRRGSERFV